MAHRHSPTCLLGDIHWIALEPGDQEEERRENPFVITWSSFIKHHKVNCFKNIASVVLVNPPSAPSPLAW